jgi:DHA2 family multidrug resistance protein
MLLSFRVLQGAVAGFMVPLSQALLLNSYPPRDRGLALAIWGMTITVAPVIGPILGGWITDNYHWSWIFLINVPIGIVAAIITWQMLKDRETPTQRLPVDSIGMGLLVLWVGSLQILLDKGEELDWFNSPFILSLGIVAALGFALFMAWELTDEHPIVDLSLFKFSNFRVGLLLLALAYSVFFLGVVILPLWLQTQMNYTALWAGYAIAPTGIFAIVFSPLVGRYMRNGDPRLIVTGAFIIFAAVNFWRSEFTPNADFLTIMLPQLFQGIAMAMFFAPLININLGGIEPSRVADASGVQNFMRMMAASFGTSLAVSFWDHQEKLHRSNLVEHINSYSQPADDYIEKLHGLGLHGHQAFGYLDGVLSGQSYMLATNDVFRVAALLFLLLIPVLWFTRPPFGHAGAAH